MKGTRSDLVCGRCGANLRPSWDYQCCGDCGAHYAEIPPVPREAPVADVPSATPTLSGGTGPVDARSVFLRSFLIAVVAVSAVAATRAFEAYQFRDADPTEKLFEGFGALFLAVVGLPLAGGICAFVGSRPRGAGIALAGGLGGLIVTSAGWVAVANIAAGTSADIPGTLIAGVIEAGLLFLLGFGIVFGVLLMVHDLQGSRAAAPPPPERSRRPEPGRPDEGAPAEADPSGGRPTASAGTASAQSPLGSLGRAPAVALTDSPAAVLGVWRVIGSEAANVAPGDQVALGIDGGDLVITKPACGEADRRGLDSLDATDEPDGLTRLTIGSLVFLDLAPVAGTTDRLVGVIQE